MLTPLENLLRWLMRTRIFWTRRMGGWIRIMAEYSVPMARFRRERIQDTVVFFGSARFRARDVASKELELLANTGSKQPAPDEEQPASAAEVETGETTAA